MSHQSQCNVSKGKSNIELQIQMKKLEDQEGEFLRSQINDQPTKQNISNHEKE